MADRSFRQVVLPVGDETDARSSARAVLPYLQRAGGEVHVVHVIEKAGGAPDKAGVEQRESAANDMFDAATQVFLNEGFHDFETDVVFATDVAEGILDVARDRDATAIVFTPRGGSRLARLLSGDVSLSLITETDRPVIVLPEPSEEDSAHE